MPPSNLPPAHQSEHPNKLCIRLALAHAWIIPLSPHCPRRRCCSLFLRKTKMEVILPKGITGATPPRTLSRHFPATPLSDENPHRGFVTGFWVTIYSVHFMSQLFFINCWCLELKCSQDIDQHIFSIHHITTDADSGLAVFAVVVLRAVVVQHHYQHTPRLGLYLWLQLPLGVRGARKYCWFWAVWKVR